MSLPHDRREFHHFDEVLHVIDGHQLNVAWRVSCILCAGEMERLTPDERRDLGQQLQAALLRSGQYDWLRAEYKAQ